MKFLRLLLKILIPLAVLGGGAAGGMYLIKTAPDAKRRPPKPLVPVVEVMEVQPGDYTVRLKSHGTVTPRTQSTLIPEVAGRIVWVAENFRNGRFFEAGEELVRIDPRDYEHALTMAMAELAQARLTLREEEAQVEQAKRDWEKLRMEGTPSDLLLRQPQLDSSRAGVEAAKARLYQARTDLERTHIRAPYAGRVLEKQVDLGQYVSPGSLLSSLYAIDYAEVRLPITDRQSAFLDLPESYRGEAVSGTQLPVTLIGSSGGMEHRWEGRIVRTEGAIDIHSRQLFIIAQVDNPYARSGEGRPPLKVGQFVEAEIRGNTLTGVFVIPRQALRTGDEVLVVNSDNRIERRPLKVAWSDRKSAVISSGLKAGDRISLTPLPFAANGAPVRLKGEKPERMAKAAGK